MERVYNFSPGPSAIPLEVLQKAQSEFIVYGNKGMSVIEMSHRSGMYLEIYNKAIENAKKLMNISDDYAVLFLHGGATMQFSSIPLNMPNVYNKAFYIDSGSFAKKAAEESSRFRNTEIIASSKSGFYKYIPTVSTEKLNENADYLHITTNNTIYGTRYTSLPETSIPLVADASSNILSENLDINKFAVIYAGTQKNIGPSGLCFMVVNKKFITDASDICPILLSWKEQHKAESMYNTPNTFAIYMANLSFEHLISIGGVETMEQINIEKANLLYNAIDNSSIFKGTVQSEFRSRMNVTFITGNEELDAKFISQATKNGLVNLKGHRSVGGMRASIYNAMPIEGVKALVDFIKNFDLENK